VARGRPLPVESFQACDGTHVWVKWEEHDDITKEPIDNLKTDLGRSFNFFMNELVTASTKGKTVGQPR
jgi:hypothetical protein